MHDAEDGVQARAEAAQAIRPAPSSDVPPMVIIFVMAPRLQVKYRQDTKKRHHRLHVEEPGWGLDDPLLPPALHTHNFSCEEKRCASMTEKCHARVMTALGCGTDCCRLQHVRSRRAFWLRNSVAHRSCVCVCVSVRRVCVCVRARVCSHMTFTVVMAR